MKMKCPKNVKCCICECPYYFHQCDGDYRKLCDNCLKEWDIAYNKAKTKWFKNNIPLIEQEDYRDGYYFIEKDDKKPSYKKHRGIKHGYNKTKLRGLK